MMQRILCRFGNGHMTFLEACRVGATAGDKEAATCLAALESPEARIRDALVEAAVEKHPDWRRDGKFIVGPDDEVGTAGLIDWYRLNYSAEAAAIERGLAGEA